jgi:hypothetical protein
MVGAAFTLNVRVLELVAPWVRVALARSVTEPKAPPVIVIVFTPATAAADVRPDTDPGPAVCANVIVREESAPVVTVFPRASSIVAVTVSPAPAPRSVPELLRTICVACPALTVMPVLVVTVSDPSVALSLYAVALGLSIEQPVNGTTP